MLQTFRTLHFRNYRLLWLGNLATQVTLWMQVLAIGWLGLELTDSPLFLGVLGFIRTLPTFLFALLGGALADRWSRRRLLIVCQGGLLLNSGGLAALVAAGWIEPWHVLANSFVFGIIMAINTPARQALTASLVSQETLLNAISLHYAAQSATRILGPFLAGRAIELIGVAPTFVLQSILYLWAIAFFARMKTPPPDLISRQEGIAHNLAEGLLYVKGNRVVLSLMSLTALLNFAGMPYIELLPGFARDVLGAGPSELGVLLSVAGVGALIGTLALASLGEVRHKGAVLLGTVLLFGLFLTTFSATPWFALSVLLLTVLGALGTIFRTTSNTLLQTVIPDRYRGRVMGMEIMATGVTTFGSLIVGTIASLASIPLALGIGGMVCMLCALSVAVMQPGIRQLD